jgi:hypothetical protein
MAIKVEYIHIPDIAELNRSTLVKKGFAEVCGTCKLISDYPDTTKYIPVLYVYCNIIQRFFRIAGTGETVIIEQMTTTLHEFRELAEAYQRYFVRYDPVTFSSFKPDEMGAFYSTWQRLYQFFIPPFQFENSADHTTQLLISIYPVQDREYIFDLASVFDLKYRFLNLEENQPYYALSVSGISLFEFAKRLMNLFKPLTEKTLLLYGFEKHYSEKALLHASEETRMMALARGPLYTHVLEKAKAAGAEVIELCTDDDLLRGFRKGREFHLVQILTHYMHGNSPENGWLLYKQSAIRFDIFKGLLAEMEKENTLRDDVILDAVTCTNFFDFRTLYSHGIRYIYLSHHDFDTDQAAFVLYEIYTGVNAKRIGWEETYLNGRNHLHEARSNVYRCFFTLARKNESIYTP